LGLVGDSCCLDGLVCTSTDSSDTISNHWHRAMILFITAILSFVWRTGSVLDPEDRPPLGARAVLGPRIAITAVFLLGMVYLAMIVRTLKKYGSTQGSSRALLSVGMKDRIDGHSTAHRREHSTRGRNAKQPEPGGYDREMERRGRERERSTSTHVRQREEGLESRERRRESSERESRHSGLKNMLSLGLGSRFVARDGEKEVEVEMDVKVRDDVEVMRVAIPRR